MAKEKEITKSVENTAQQKDEERVAIMIPYVEGEDPEQTVIINGEITKFKKGVVVYVKPNVAEVLANSNKQMMSALENQKKFKEQVMNL